MAVEPLPCSRHGGGVERMTAYEHEAELFSPPPRSGTRRFRALSLLGAAGFVAYAAAVVLGAPRPILTLVFTGVMILVPPSVWWAYARAPHVLRRPFLLLAIAATFWLIGSA